MKRVSVQQLRILIAMDDPAEDSVGLALQSLSGHELRTYDSLVDRGLARRRPRRERQFDLPPDIARLAEKAVREK
jgi:hypothetical protein